MFSSHQPPANKGRSRQELNLYCTFKNKQNDNIQRLGAIQKQLYNSKIGLINEKMEFGSLKRWNKYKIELYLQLWMRCTTLKLLEQFLEFKLRKLFKIPLSRAKLFSLLYFRKLLVTKYLEFILDGSVDCPTHIL